MARLLQPSDAQACVVGGAVRDALLGRPLADLDLAVSAAVDDLARDLASAMPATLVVLDEERRHLRLVPRQQAKPIVDLIPLQGDLPADLRRRDLTIDAMAVDLAQAAAGPAAVLDLHGGLDDLRSRTIRLTSEAVLRDDPARLLRAVRLGAELGFDIEPSTGAAIRRNARLLSHVPPERVLAELSSILEGPGSARALRLLDDLGLLTQVFPELEEARGVSQPKEHYYNVLDHSIEAVEAMEQMLRQSPGDPTVLAEVPWDEETQARFQEPVAGGRPRSVLLKLAALLHDVAKPASKTVEANGRIRFLGHAKLGAAVTETILRRLRLSIRETDLVVAMAREHLRPGLICMDGGPSRRALYRYYRDAGDAAVDTLYLSFADYRAARGPLLELSDWQRYCGGIRGILEAGQEEETGIRPPPLVDGHDLMRELGLKPGPQVGALLEAVREAAAAGDVTTKSDAIALARRMLT